MLREISTCPKCNGVFGLVAEVLTDEEQFAGKMIGQEESCLNCGYREIKEIKEVEDVIKYKIEKMEERIERRREKNMGKNIIEKYKIIADVYEAGWNYKQIKEKMKFDSGTIKKALDYFEIERKPRGRRSKKLEDMKDVYEKEEISSLNQVQLLKKILFDLRIDELFSLSVEIREVVILLCKVWYDKEKENEKPD